ncbi:MAG: RusA family crossover junction endodeoxyribonuclease [Cyanobium sp. 49614_E6]|nr:RusA family crossover junction endodeoxyribonuclease [Cyanobium sp. 49614_E6]
MADLIHFNIEGIRPAPQGSKKHVGRGVMVDMSANLKPWREAVRQEALKTGAAMALGPVSVELVFRFARPKGHFNTKGQLKPSAPMHVIVKPDIDKIERSVLDGLTGVLFKDDSQVCCLYALKVYCKEGELEGCEVIVKNVGVGG